MKTLLQIQSSIFSNGGQSSQLAARFVAAWRKANPGARVIGVQPSGGGQSVGGGGRVRVGISRGNGAEVGEWVACPGTDVSCGREVVGLGKRAPASNEREVEAGANASRTPPSVSDRIMLPSTIPQASRAVTRPMNTPPTRCRIAFI